MEMCSAPGCTKPRAYGRTKHCEAHYCRLRRYGQFDLPARPDLKHDHGYVLKYVPTHPLTQRHSGPREYEHRIVFYNHHGEGPFSCHWCGVHVSWDTMHVDHLNDVKDDNDIGNLVASCARCNQKRGAPQMLRNTRAKRGTHLTLDGRTRFIGDWAKDVGISANSIKRRLASGWSVERALTEPRGPTGPRTAREQGFAKSSR